MNTDKLRIGWTLISQGAAQIAAAYGEIDQPAPAGDAAGVPTQAARGVTAAPPAVTPASIASRATPPPTESAFTECPAHRKEWTEGNFGPYCSAPSDDPSPEWTNAKGYCRVTPKNAGAWLRKHPRGEAA